MKNTLLKSEQDVDHTLVNFGVYNVTSTLLGSVDINMNCQNKFNNPRFCDIGLNTSKGTITMAHQIHLKPRHTELILSALLQSLEIKAQHLKPETIKETQAQYEGAAEKLMLPVTCGRSNNNIFTWVADQIRHTPGLRDRELGMRVIQICDVAARDRYHEYCEE